MRATAFIIGLIGLGVAIDYSLLVVVRWREERARGAESDAAIATAMGTAGRAVAFSGTTVAVGLLALVVVPVPAMLTVCCVLKRGGRSRPQNEQKPRVSRAFV